MYRYVNYAREALSINEKKWEKIMYALSKNKIEPIDMRLLSENGIPCVYNGKNKEICYKSCDEILNWLDYVGLRTYFGIPNDFYDALPKL